MTDPPVTFEPRGVVHLLRPWGGRAHDLAELRGSLAGAPDDVLFVHAVQYVLRHPGATELPPDDLSDWIATRFQDRGTAERIAFAIQTRNGSPVELKAALLEILDAAMVRRTARPTPEDDGFVFRSAVSVPVPLDVAVASAAELMDVLLAGDPSIWFLHMMEEPWHGGGRVPLLDWLRAIGEPRLAGWLLEAATDGLPIETARAKAMSRWRRRRIARRMSATSEQSESERREAGRQVVARLARRISRSEPST